MTTTEASEPVGVRPEADAVANHVSAVTKMQALVQNAYGGPEVLRVAI